MIRIVYASRLSSGVNPDCVDSICMTASARNKAHGVTGLLLFNGHEFLQCLEGKRADVQEIYQFISGSSLHHDITILKVERCKSRLFDGWSMMGHNLSAIKRNSGIPNPFSYLDHRLNQPWFKLGPSAMSLFLEYAKIKQELAILGSDSVPTNNIGQMDLRLERS